MYINETRENSAFIVCCASMNVKNSGLLYNVFVVFRRVIE